MLDECEMQKALLLTFAAYEEKEVDALKYLNDRKLKHDFRTIIPAKMPHEDESREITYIVAEDSKDNIFISFHGTTRLKDFEEFNLKIKQNHCKCKKACACGGAGGFHEGFWKIAKMFPFTTVFNKEWWVERVFIEFMAMGASIFYVDTQGGGH